MTEQVKGDTFYFVLFPLVPIFIMMVSLNIEHDRGVNHTKGFLFWFQCCRPLLFKESIQKERNYYEREAYNSFCIKQKIKELEDNNLNSVPVSNVHGLQKFREKEGTFINYS